MITGAKEGQEVEVKTDVLILLIKTRAQKPLKHALTEKTIVIIERRVTEIGVTEEVISTAMTGEKIRRLLKARMNW
jgi:hypothetical protein